MKKTNLLLVSIVLFAAFFCASTGVASAISLGDLYVGNTVVDLVWTEYMSYDFSKYKLYRDDAPIHTEYNRNTTFYRDGGRSKGVTYNYKIEVYNATGVLVGEGSRSVTTGDVHGTITQSTTWTAATSPYSLTDDVNVHDGAILTIENGMTVNSGTHKLMIINGGLSPLQSATFNGEGIYLNETDGCSIKDCVFNGTAVAGGYIGIELDHCDNCIISDTIVKNYPSRSIYLHSSYGCTLIKNTVSNTNRPGFYLYESNDNTLTNNIASDISDHGIYLHSSSDCTLTGNTANNNIGNGISLISSDNNTLTNNTANNNGDGGIELDNSDGNTVTENTANSNSIQGIIVGTSSENVLTSNTANSNGQGGIILYGEGSSGNTLTGNTANLNGEFGIKLNYAGNNNILIDNTAESTTEGDGSGILLCHSNYATLTNNNANANKGYGIYLRYSSNNTLTSNTANSNGQGGIILYGEGSSGNTLTCNTANLNGEFGIKLDHAGNNNILIDNTAESTEGDGSGIKLFYSNYATLTNNNANANEGYGIYLRYSNNNTLTSNTANSNNEEGIFLMFSRYNTLTGNTMSGNYNFGVYGLELPEYIQNIDTSNTVNGKAIYYWVEKQGQQIPSDAGFVAIVNSSDITVKDLTLTNNYKGVVLAYSTKSTIENINAANNKMCGIYLYKSTENTLIGNSANSNHDWWGIMVHSSYNNNFTENEAKLNGYGGIYVCEGSNDNLFEANIANNNSQYGIYLYKSSGNRFTGNSANNNFMYGIWLKSSSDNTFTSNSANDDCYVGIHLDDSSDNTFSSNSVNNNRNNGINLWWSSDNNIFSSNTINNNGDDILLEGSGIYLQESSDNTFTSNSVNNNSDDGICLYCEFSSSNNNIFTSNSVNNNSDDGIFLDGPYYGSDNNMAFTNNTVNNNGGFGILLKHSSKNTLTSNSANNNGVTGIFLSGSNNILTDNTAINNHYGISLSGSNNILTINTAINNRASGIRLGSKCSSNNIENNVLVRDTTKGDSWSIYVDSGAENNIFKENTVGGNYPTKISVHENYHEGFKIRGVENPPEQPEPPEYPTIRRNISNYVEMENLSAETTLFLDFHYEDKDVEDIDEESLKVWKHNGTAWDEGKGADAWNGTRKLDTANNIVGVEVKKFCIFAPLAGMPVHNINTGEDFYTIQEAIDDSETMDGHTITVDPSYTKSGTKENICVDKELTIKSSFGNISDTVIEAADSGKHVIEVVADEVAIQGFTITGATGEGKAGVYIHSSTTDYTISQSIITDNNLGILCDNAHALVLENVKVWNNGKDGVRLLGGDLVIKGTDNEIINNGGNGTCVSAEGNVTIEGATEIHDNGGWGIYNEGGGNVDIHDGAMSSINKNGKGGIYCNGLKLPANFVVDDNGGPGIDAGGGVVGGALTKTLILESVKVRNNNGDGIHVLGANLVIKGTDNEITCNGGNGIFAERGNITIEGTTEIHDNGGWGIYNGGWGIYNDVAYLGIHDGAMSSINRNGKGGIWSDGGVTLPANFVVDDNGGHGIVAGGGVAYSVVGGNVTDTLILESVKVRNNKGDGIVVHDGRDGNLVIAGTGNEITNNGGNGTSVWSGFVVIEGATEIHDNSGWGINSVDGEYLYIRKGAMSSINRNGKGGIECGGGVKLPANFVVDDNGGHGIVAGGGVAYSVVGGDVTDTLILESVKVRNNKGDGIVVHDGRDGNLVIAGTGNEITNNGGNGTSVWSGFVVIEGATEIHDNSGWGINSVDGEYLYIRKGAMSSINRNGKGGIECGGGVKLPANFVVDDNGGHGIVAGGGVAYSVVGGDVTDTLILESVKVRNNKGDGIVVHDGRDGNLVIAGTGNEITNNGGNGTSVWSGFVVIEGATEIHDNSGWGINSVDGEYLYIRKGAMSSINRNGKGGIECGGGVKLPANFVVDDNGGHGIVAGGGVAYSVVGGDVTDTLILESVKVRNNKGNGVGVVDANLLIKGTGSKITNNGGWGIHVDTGKVNIRDAEITNNANGGIQLISSNYGILTGNKINSNKEAGIMLLYSNKNEVKNNEITHNCRGIKEVDCTGNKIYNNSIQYNTCSTGIHLDNSGSEIIGNTITDDEGDGIHCINGSNPLINWNNIYNNTGYGLNNLDASVEINARHNWWGNASGPGDEVSGNVNYSNWLDAPVGVVPHIEVEKSVWDAEAEEWTYEVEADVDDVVRFQLFVHNDGVNCSLTNIVVNDTLLSNLEYADNATHEPDAIVGNRLTWNFAGPLEPCENITIEFDARVTECCDGVNAVNATAWSEKLQYGVRADDRAVVKVLPSIEVEKKVWDTGIEEWVEEISAEVGDNATFQLWIHHDGSCCPISGIVVEDTLPEGLEFVSAEPVPNEVVKNHDNSIMARWNLGITLEPCENTSIEMVANVTKGGELENEVSVNATGCGYEVSDTDVATVIAVGGALEANFRFVPTEPAVYQAVRFFDETTGGYPPYSYEWDFNNDTIFDSTEANPTWNYTVPGTYTVTLKVNDTEEDTDTTEKIITVHLPPNITAFAPPSPVNDTVCNWRTFNVTVNQTVNVSWYLNNTRQHTNVSTKEASYTLHAEVVGEHNVSAVATNGNGTDMQTWVWNVTAAPLPVLEINKTDVPDPVSPGGALNYTIRVNNAGNANATTVTVKETYDGNVTFLDAVPAPSSGNDTWQFATLNASETRWINIFVIVNASVLNGTVLHNFVNVTCDEGVTDSDTENTTVFVAHVPALEINKTGVPDPVSPGGTLNYTIHVNNTGNATATNVTVKETYDGNVTFVDAVPAPSQGNDTWIFATLNVNETRWINISVTVNASVLNGTVLHNVVNVTCDEGVMDSDTENTTVFVAPVPVLEITKTDDSAPVSPGGTLNYTILVNNTGNATATNVAVMETYDKNVTFVAAVPAPSSGDDTWIFATLNVSERRWINISVTVNASVLNGTVLHNIVNVTCDEGVTDSDTTDTTVLFKELNCTCGDICVNTTGWWQDGEAFNPSSTPIQHAIDNATAGEIICVKDGTYTENVDVYKRLTIRSENGAASTSVLAASSYDYVFEVTADYVNISGFHVTDATKRTSGIYLYGANYCNISDNNANENSYHGIFLNSSNNNYLINNTVSGNKGDGFKLESNSNHNRIIGNNASDNDKNGIRLYGTTGNPSSHNTVANNTADLNDKSGIMIEGADSDHNTIVNNTCKLNDYGISVRYGDYNNLTKNTCNQNTEYGIRLYQSADNNEITNNTAISNTEYGIYISSSDYNIIYNNYFNNTHNADDNGNNVWNTTKTLGTNIIGGPYLGGNYWSDYAGRDTNGDGLGDTFLPYNSNGNITNGGDYHPLVPEGFEPLLSIEKSDNPDPVSPGGTLNYSISVNNTGNATATNVTVTETYDVNVTFVGAVPAPSLGNDTWQFATLNVSETRWINISVTVNASVLNGTVLHNVVNVTCDEGVSDSDTEDTTVISALAPVLEINKTGVPDPVLAGGTLNYSISVNNTGNATATNVTVTETYDGNVTFVTAVPAPSSGDDTWIFATLNTSETRWINISVIVNASVLNGTVLHNVVNVTCDEGVSDSDTEDTTVISALAPVLEINKTGVPDPVMAGGTLNYTISVNNTGNATATNVTVTETYDGNVTFVAAVPAPSQGNDTWKFATLNVSETRWINISVIVNASVLNGTVLHNIVNVTCDEGVTDTDTENTTVFVAPALPPNITSFAPPSPVNDTVCNWRTFNVTVDQTVNVSWYLNNTLRHTNVSTKEASYSLHAEVVGEHNVSAIASNGNGTDMQSWLWNVTAAPLPVLEINKTDNPDPVSPGGTLNYTIRVNNSGNATAINVIVKEAYDENVTFIAAEPAPSSGDDTWQFATLNASETRWVNISVAVNASVLNGTVLHNIVNVSCDEGVTDLDTENTTVFAAPVLNCTCGDICVNETGWWRDGGNFNANGTPIQAAVNNANAGETICVKDGTYTENVDVNKRLTLKSENGAVSAIVNALYPNDDVFEVSADSVSISGFTVKGATGAFGTGITLTHGVSYCDLSNNNCSGSRCGITLCSCCSHNTLTNNIANSNDIYGIHLFSSNSNNLTNNIANSNKYNGIHLYSSNNNAITNNIANSNNNSFGYGISLFWESCNNTLEDNTANSNNNGINLDSSSNYNTLANNTADSNDNYGIYLSYSSKNMLESNTADSNSGDGISLSSSSNNTLTSNTASNSGIGTHLYSSSNYNMLTGNTASNNDYGIRLSVSSSNLIYNNYFNNTRNAWDDGNNVWNTTKTLGTNIIGGPYLGGNYWSDYSGKDLDGDGLGDTLLPHNSSGGITNDGDYHPLVPVGYAPILSIEKSDNPDPVSPAGTLNYSIRVNNTGNATATNVTVMETYDKNVTFVAAVPAPSPGNDTWQFPTLNFRETRWINISVTVNASVPNGTVLHNIANVSCDEGVTDLDTENTTVFAVQVCVETATGTGLACFVTDSGTIEDLVAVDESTLPEEGKPKLVFPHGFFSFNITGLTQGRTVEVTLTLPDNVPVGTEYWKYHASEGGWIRIPMGSDDGDNEITITLVDGGLGDDDGTANGVIVDQGGPGVRAIKPKLRKSAPTSVAPGGTITYTILYANVGPVALTEVTITENYPEDVTFISAVPVPDAGTNNKWTIGTLPAGASGQIIIKVKVPDSRDLSFTETGSVTGEGFVMVSKDLSTEQKPYRLKNVVTITCAETDPVTASAFTTVSGVPGTSLEITEHGSGIYESEEILNFGTKNKSIRLQKSTDAEYQPTSFNFSDSFSVDFTNKWMQDICSKNMVMGDAMHKKIKHATYIRDETKTETGEYGTELEFASSFHGAAHIGVVSKDVTTSEDYIGEFELFWAAKEECQYLFNWSRVPGNDSEKLIRFLVDNLAINWAENATITKSDDDRIINISTDWRSADVILAANNETATVKVANETIYVLDVRTEDGTLNVYDCKLRKISESVTGEGYVMVDKELASGHIQVVEHGSGIYSSDTDFDSQRLNTSTEAEYQPTTFNFSDGFGVNFSSNWMQGICSKDKKAGTAIHKKISDATSIADDTTATKSSMAFETSFNGSIHVGARTKGTRISEDYIGRFNVSQVIKIGDARSTSTSNTPNTSDSSDSPSCP